MRSLIARLPLTLRAMVLVPLLAAGLDGVRASIVCAPGAQSCLIAAGQGWLGGVGTIVLVLYALGLAGLLARFARGRATSRWLWLLAIATLWSVVGGQALLATVLGTGAALGGGWVHLLVLAAVAGAALALALRVLPDAVREFLPAAPVAAPRPELALAGPGRLTTAPSLRPARLARDRAPPARG